VVNLGVVGLLDAGVTDKDKGPTRFCLMRFFAVWFQFRSASATLSLKIVGFIVEPFCVTRA